MKKLFTTILVFLGLLTIGVSVGVNAADETVTFEFYNGEKLTSTGGTTVDQTYLNSKITSGTANFVTKCTLSGNVRYDMNGGLTTGASKATGTMTLTLSSEISKVEIIGAEYDSNKVFKVNDATGTGTLAAKGTKLADVTTSVVWNLSPSTTELKITTDGKRATIYKLILTKVSTEGLPYSISYDANGGTFVAGKGEAIENIAAGTETPVTLPVAADLSSTPCSNFTKLTGWNDGSKVHEPGTTLSVTKGTTFVAQYAAVDPITIADAVSLIDSENSDLPNYSFSIIGTIESIPYAYSSTNKNISLYIIDDSTSTKIEAYKMTGGIDLFVGDLIKVTGKLTKYKDTYEFDEGCTYELITLGAPHNFSATETKASLKVAYDATDPNLKATDVDLRFGGIITADAYVEGATYGVLVVKGASTLTAGATKYATADEFIKANTNYQNVVCTPEKVADGYQFAWVITNMEGHYNDDLTAVMYMEYNGGVYLSTAKTTNVVASAKYYYENYEAEGLTEDQALVLMGIAG